MIIAVVRMAPSNAFSSMRTLSLPCQAAMALRIIALHEEPDRDQQEVVRSRPRGMLPGMPGMRYTDGIYHSEVIHVRYRPHFHERPQPGGAFARRLPIQRKRGADRTARRRSNPA